MDNDELSTIADECGNNNVVTFGESKEMVTRNTNNEEASIPAKNYPDANSESLFQQRTQYSNTDTDNQLLHRNNHNNNDANITNDTSDTNEAKKLSINGPAIEQLVARAIDKLKEIGLIDSKESAQKQQIILALVAALASTLVIIILMALWLCLIGSSGSGNVATNDDDVQQETVKRMDSLIKRIALLDNMLTSNGEEQFQQQIQQLITLYAVLKLKVTSAKAFLSSVKVAMDSELIRRANVTAAAATAVVVDNSNSDEPTNVTDDQYKLAFLFKPVNVSATTTTNDQESNLDQLETQDAKESNATEIEAKLLLETKQNQQKQLQSLLIAYESEINVIYEAIEKSYSRRHQLSECLATSDQTTNTGSKDTEQVDSDENSEDDAKLFERLSSKFREEPIDFEQSIVWLQLYGKQNGVPLTVTQNEVVQENGQR